MKRLGIMTALERLAELREEYRSDIVSRFEHAALPCSQCSNPGACCTDEHFVNVHISRLESVNIADLIDRLDAPERERVKGRIRGAILIYELSDDGDTFARTFACPLFERGTGCLVHNDGKPFPCLTHACYERREDVPPDEMLSIAETRIDRLNDRAFGRGHRWLPLPVAIADELAARERHHAKRKTGDSTEPPK